MISLLTHRANNNIIQMRQLVLVSVSRLLKRANEIFHGAKAVCHTLLRRSVPVLLNRFLSRAHFGRSLQSLQNHLPRPEAPPIDQLQAPALALGRIKLFVDAKLCNKTPTF